LPKKPTRHISDKKYGVFQSDASFFNEVANELGLLSQGNDKELRYHRHPLAFLVEAADDICYTIIDFEDGINLGLIDEEFALEYLIKLVKDNINTAKYNSLKVASDRLAYLRSLAINTLISEAAAIFLQNEKEILTGSFNEALLEKSNYKAQIKDIIKISIEKVYNSEEVVEKEIAGYTILSTLLDAFTLAFENVHHDRATHYDNLIVKNFKSTIRKDSTVYGYIMECCSFISGLTDGNALQIFNKIRGNL
jgi:dGTPase